MFSNTAATTGSYLASGGIANSGVLTVINSSVVTNTATYGAGGIENTGAMTVTNSTVNGSSAQQNNSAGGIETGGTLTVTNSTISHNSGYNGGGLHTDNGSTTTLTNSTLSGNYAGRTGGGIADLGQAGTMLQLFNTTVSGNSAGSAGGIYNLNPGLGSGPFILANTILAGNSAPLDPDCYGTLTSLDYNIVGTIVSGDCTVVINGLAVAPNGDIFTDTFVGNGFANKTALIKVRPGGRIQVLWKS